MNDTLKLLRECDVGVKMGLSSIDEVTPKSQSEDMRKMLSEFRAEHDNLLAEIQSEISKLGDDGKNPNPIAKGMSWMKTNFKLAVDESDNTIAKLMTEGCVMGIDSIERYLSEFSAADDKSRKYAHKLIDLERRMITDMKRYIA